MDTTQKGFIYKITDVETKQVYIGSTKWYAQRKSMHFNMEFGNCSITKLIKNKGKQYFEFAILKEIEYSDKKELRKAEQDEINKVDKEKRINKNRAWIDPEKKNKIYESSRSPNSPDCVQYKLDLKREARRRYAQKLKEDPVRMEKERERNKLKMREKRKKIKESLNNNNQNKEPSHRLNGHEHEEVVPPMIA